MRLDVITRPCSNSSEKLGHGQFILILNGSTGLLSNHCKHKIYQTVQGNTLHSVRTSCLLCNPDRELGGKTRCYKFVWFWKPPDSYLGRNRVSWLGLTIVPRMMYVHYERCILQTRCSYNNMRIINWPYGLMPWGNLKVTFVHWFRQWLGFIG